VRKLGVGYKDVTHNEFWCRGHMPGMPVMPGVVMCEAAAQLCTYLSQKYDLLGTKMVGLGALDEVRFRDPVYPGDRLIVVAALVKVRRQAIVVSRFQEFVGQSLVCEGIIKGVPLPEKAPQR
jgi:3-hydroxyacyl-[acyl-carrier-protein] dehydratase